MPCRSVRDTCELLIAEPEVASRLESMRIEELEVASTCEHSSTAVLVAGYLNILRVEEMYGKAAALARKRYSAHR